MIALITTSIRALDRMRERTWNIGRLLTPRMCTSIGDTIERGYPWAADCDGFGGVDVPAYLKMLSMVARTPEGCRFVVAPDAVGDARETTRLFAQWQPILRDCNLPAAYVLQDGIEAVRVPWDECAAVFVGGTTPFKISGVAARVVAEALERGKWVHMGRVNTPDRAAYARSIGCHSFDGSQWGRFPDRDLDELVSILEGENGGQRPQLPGQGVLGARAA